MNMRIGLWIDHRQAVIVHLFDFGEETIRIVSQLPKRVRFSGASYSRDENDFQNDFAEDKRDKRYEALLKRYLDDVIGHLGKADSILIFGPGEAKTELQNRLIDTGFASHIVGVEAADKMTERQISAKVRHYFQDIDEQSRVR